MAMEKDERGETIAYSTGRPPKDMGSIVGDDNGKSHYVWGRKGGRK